MRSMPILQCSSGSYALPLCERTASRLLPAMLCEEADRRVALFTACAAADPALLIWAVCRAHQHGLELHSHEAVASWLERQVRQEFVMGRVRLISTEAAAAFEALHRESSRLAAAVHQVAEQGVDAVAAQYLSTLRYAPDWLHAARIEGEQGEAAVLPPWVVDLTARLAADAPPPDEPVALGVVRRAISIVKESGGSEAASSGSQWEERAGCGEDAADAIVTLCRRLSRLDDLEHDFAQTVLHSRLEGMKELAYGAGHEINNPLANISARAQTLLAEERDPERRRKLAAINTQAFRAHEMIADMMLFARPPQLNLSDVSIPEIADRVAQNLKTRAAAQHTSLTLDLPAQPVHLRADATQLTVAITAICTNSLEALREGGQVQITVRPIDPAQSLEVQSAGYVAEIVISDDGPGIPSDVRPRLFDPFFSGREAGRGLGMGLAKCWRIVTSHRGSIIVEDRVPHGAAFRILLRREPLPS